MRLHYGIKVQLEPKYAHEFTQSTLVIYYNADRTCSRRITPGPTANRDYQGLVNALTSSSTESKNYHSWIVV